ncbi:MAG: hypothetical protein H0U24_06150 [Thermoleophilaceae bacterium]|nr:hypothetical protein [Thermoleophilaceae bacterium]
MILRPAALVVLLGALLASGCSDGAEGVPAACRQGPEAVRTALRQAPGPVTLDGTPLSECIDDTSGGGDLRDVGTAYVEAAAVLAPAAARNPDGAAAVQLGYLMGAFTRSKAGAQGVGYELGRRLRSELLSVDVRSPAFVRGERAGRRTG